MVFDNPAANSKHPPPPRGCGILTVSGLRQALQRDSGSSRAHLNLGILSYEQGRRDSAITHLEQALDREPYLDEACYYLSLARLEQGDTLKAERDLYYISRISEFYSPREYLLGRIAMQKGDLPGAEKHLKEAALANGYNLSAKDLLAVLYREQGRASEALKQLEVVEEIDPTDRWAAAERFFLSRQDTDRQQLLALLGGQSQEALELSGGYRALSRWENALEILGLVEENNRDPYGTPAVFYYTKASCLKALGRPGESAEYFKKGSAARANIDRFPYRPESIRPLAEAIVFDPSDVTARFELGCLLYSLDRKSEAIFQWERGVALAPDDFSLQRSLGLAYYENGYGIEKAATNLEAAIRLNPSHIRTFADLSSIYSREGHFDEQVALLKKALQRSPADDNIIEGLITVNLVRGNYKQADSLIRSHTFAQRHRNYSLRDKYRFLHYGMGAQAFNGGKPDQALKQFQLSLTPPSSLGADDFQFQGAPRLHYYIGRSLEQKGDLKGAQGAWSKGIVGWDQLSGDRDSRNSENFYMVLCLERLGMKDQARELLSEMQKFAASQLENSRREDRAEANYLLALVKKSEGEYAESARLLEEAVKIEPDMLGPRFELRGDVVDPLPEKMRMGSR